MQEASFPRLLGDIGGTNARFAWQPSRDAAPGRVAIYPCAEHESLLAAMRHYLAQQQLPAPGACAIGIANPVTGDHVQMTNHTWSFSIEQVRLALGLTRFLVLNDFTALALSLTLLPADELRQVGGGQAVPKAPIGLIGPGTGLGVSGLWAGLAGGPAVPINGEGGHVTLAAADASEEAVVALLRQRFGHCSAERAVSGPGLVNLYEALCTLDGVAAEALEAADITLRAEAGDSRCNRVLDLFFSFLGNVAGNLALTLGTRGGMYIGGGIVPRLGARIDRSRFRERFEQKGRFADYLARVPTFVVEAKLSPALLGAARALDEL